MTSQEQELLTRVARPTKLQVEEVLASTWRQYGGWPAVESGMVNMVGLMADSVMALYAPPATPSEAYGPGEKP